MEQADRVIKIHLKPPEIQCLAAIRFEQNKAKQRMNRTANLNMNDG